MSAKILVTGLPNTGKTSLLGKLKDVLVIARDGKPFSLELPHFNVPEYSTVDELLDMVQEKIETYKEKFKEYPKTIAFDSVSRIFTDIETSCNRRFNGFDVWTNVNKEINLFLEAINQLQEAGFNVILVAHAVWDENAKKFIETAKGSFAKIGGFLSTVDYAINIDLIGKKRVITHRGNSLSRSLIDEVPDKEDASEFDFQEYINLIRKRSTNVIEKWSI